MTSPSRRANADLPHLSISLFEQKEGGLSPVRSGAGEPSVVALGAGDLFVIYTDGITEAVDAAGEEFGEARLEALIGACADLSCGEVQVRILETVRAFTRGVEQSDDQTLVIGKIV